MQPKPEQIKWIKAAVFVACLIPLGQLTILVGTIATASGPHAGAHEGQLVRRFDFEGSGTLEWVVQRHAAVATFFGLAAIAVWLFLRREGLRFKKNTARP